tara:strand:+ start:262 stop:507 length:246 start_codon:yes stop_codon:yes gene_type:complete
MTKTQAHAILNQCKESYVSLALTNTALERTGDLCRASGESLRFDGHEQRNNRPCQAHDQAAEIGFSYSKYLDCPEVEGVKS